MRKILFISFMIVILLSSCSTIKSVESQRPSWIDEPPFVALSTVFIGEGEGKSLEEARINAMLNAIEKMGEQVEIDYTNLYFTELYTTKGIAQFGTTISDEYYTESDGVWHDYIMTLSNTAKLNESRSKDYNERLERESRLVQTVEDAGAYYRDNKDVKAVNALLRAVEITLEGEITLSDYSTEKLVERIEKYISQIKFESIERGKRTNGFSAFRITRNKGLLHPAVEEADCSVIYPSLSPEGKILSLSYSAQSDSRGLIIINRTNAYSLKKGTMSVTISLDEDIIKRIDDKAGEELLSGVKALVNEIAFTADYVEDETYESKDALIALALFDYAGTAVDITEAKEKIYEMCSSLSLTPVEVVALASDDEDEALSGLEESYSSRSVIYMVRIGIVDVLRVMDKWYINTEGYIVRIDNLTGERKEYKTTQYVTANEGESPLYSRALINQLGITVGFVLGEF